MNLEDKNMLVHKLSKYQTLYSTNGNKDIYQQKIKYYTQKLNDMGLSNHQVGGVDVQAAINRATLALKQKTAAPSTNVDELRTELLASITKLTNANIEKETANANVQRLLEYLESLSRQQGPELTLEDLVSNELSTNIFLINVEAQLRSYESANKVLESVGAIKGFTSFLKESNKTLLKRKFDELDIVLGNLKGKYNNEEKEFKNLNEPDKSSFIKYTVYTQHKEKVTKLITDVHTQLLQLAEQTTSTQMASALNGLMAAITENKELINPDSEFTVITKNFTYTPTTQQSAGSMQIYKLNSGILDF
jgi:hypothetical protein